MNRRNFIGKLALAGAGAAAVRPNIAIASNKKFRWKMTTSWPPKLPVMQDAPERFAKRVKEASNGRLKIKVYAGGELIPPLGVFEAVSQGTLEMGVSASYYWAGKSQAAQLFCSAPFGMNTLGFNSWLQSGGGQQLWDETYRKFDLVPFRFGNTGVQMAGWFKKPIKSMADLKGLKMRIPGLGGKVLAKAGGNVVLLAGSEVYTALERGTIDATEWVCPYQDERMGLYRAAKYYYYPGWHEPTTNLELMINAKAWDSLPKDLQQIVRSVAAEVGEWSHLESVARNGPALERLKTKHKVNIVPLPDEVLRTLRGLSKEVINELAAADPMAARVQKSYEAFNAHFAPWDEISEIAYARAQKL